MHNFYIESEVLCGLEDHSFLLDKQNECSYNEFTQGGHLMKKKNELKLNWIIAAYQLFLVLFIFLVVMYEMALLTK